MQFTQPQEDREKNDSEWEKSNKKNGWNAENWSNINTLSWCELASQYI